jgi:hypothetical protein
MPKIVPLTGVQEKSSIEKTHVVLSNRPSSTQLHDWSADIWDFPDSGRLAFDNLDI